MSRVALVTGGASGIGLAVCRELAKRGHRVAVLDIDGTGAEQAAEQLSAGGARARAIAADVTDRAAVESALDEIRSAFGPAEILVTSAGDSVFGPFTEIDIEVWNRMLETNLTGTFHCIQAALPDMLAAGWGRIVTIASSAGVIGSPRQAHYSAAKAGVIGLTRAVAREYGASGITVNTIPPLLVDTPMARAAERAGEIPSFEEMAQTIPAQRTGAPDDIAGACAFLCSDEASYITGQTIHVSGGAIL